MSSVVDIPCTRKNNSFFSKGNHQHEPPAPPINESMVRERLSANLPDSFNYLRNTLNTGRGRQRRSHRPHSRSSSNTSNSDRNATPPVGYSAHGGESAALSQCCDTVRNTLQLLERAQLRTGDGDGGDGFFWLDLHGVPPPAELHDAGSGDEELVGLSSPADRVLQVEPVQATSVKRTSRGGVAEPTHYVALELATLLTSVQALRQVTQASLHGQEMAATPLITSIYVVCFPTGCVTWCPASTLGLTSADRRAQRSAPAAEGQRRRRRSPHDPHEDAAAERSRDDVLYVDGDNCEEVQYVKSWEQLQASVFSRLRYMAQLSKGTASPSSPYARPAGASGELSAPPMSASAGSVLCTSIFVSLLLSSVCYAYLPNTVMFLGEVDTIDSMLPLIELDCESDQADALRRVLLLRRRLAVHRRLLFQKICLLEALDRPTMHTVARFVRSRKSPALTARDSSAGSVADQFKSAQQGSASAGGGGSSLIHHIHMMAPPSLNAIHKSIMGVLHNLEAARTVIGNTTLIYTSKVNFTNSRTSETADYYSLFCQYVLLVLLPLTIVASHWGMNCPVPFMNVNGTTPFWSIVGVIAFISVAGTIFPIYAYLTRKIYLIAAPAAEGQRRRRRSPHDPHEDAAAERSRDDVLYVDGDNCEEVQYVKSWEQLQASVFSRLRYMAQLSKGTASPSSPYARPAGASGELSAPPMSASAGSVLCTSIFVSLLLSSVCYAYLPNTVMFLGEVDTIDSMLPLIELDCESDQADALRRHYLADPSFSLTESNLQLRSKDTTESVLTHCFMKCFQSGCSTARVTGCRQ
ncbi:putative integral membrane protein [Leishmania donovani]|uniref:Putative integral membrane protein n=1 Tax=Leishmania donovani TaxID=5661 RepID=A0A504X5P2_LEIDO|nr:putative integral membrane protein [Leishmania donovani]